MKNNSEIMSEARAALNGKWRFATGTFFVMTLILIGASLIPIAGTILSLLITGPLVVGAAFVGLKIYKNEAAETNDLFFAFKHSFTNSVLAYLLMAVFILLRFLLLIVPGIIAALAYSQTYFILAENQSMDAYDAILKSKKMMMGYKWQYFKVGVRLFGLGILCLFTLGIGFLWLAPYQYVVYAKFYEELKSVNA